MLFSERLDVPFTARTVPITLIPVFLQPVPAGSFCVQNDQEGTNPATISMVNRWRP